MKIVSKIETSMTTFNTTVIFLSRPSCVGQRSAKSFRSVHYLSISYFSNMSLLLFM